MIEATTPATARLHRWLRRAALRLRARRALEGAARWLAPGIVLAALAVALLRVFPGAVPELSSHAAQVGLAALLIAVAAGTFALAAAARRFRVEEVALLADRELGTREAVATATWLRASGEAEARAERALDVVGDRPPATAFPRRPLPWRLAGLALALLVGAFFLPAWSPAPVPEPDRPDPVVAATARQLEEEITKLEEELEQREAPEQARRLLEDIQQEAARLQESTETREEATVALQRLEQRLGEERAKREAADAGALERALSALEQSALTREAARSAQQGDADALARELEKLAAAFEEGVGFEEREVMRLSVRLQEAAEALRESSHGELADQLEAIAQALEDGDAERAAELMRELLESGALERAASDAAGDAALREAQALLQQALSQVDQARPDQRQDQRVVDAAEALRQAAERLAETGQAEPAEQLETSAQALEDGQVAQAQEQLQELLDSELLRQPSGSEAGDRAASQAEATVREALRALAEAAARGQLGGEGWQGPRDRQGRPQIPQDWGVGTTNEATPDFQVQAGGNQSDRMSDETSDWREAYEALHESQRLGDARGRATRVSGQVGEGAYVSVPTWTTATEPGSSGLPEVTLPPSYQRASEEALARETIPAGYAEAVRRYFDSLGRADPSATPSPAPAPDQTGDEP